MSSRVGGFYVHSGYAGKSLIEKIRDDLDQLYDEDDEYSKGLKDGIIHALSILRSTSPEEEEVLMVERYVERLENG